MASEPRGSAAVRLIAWTGALAFAGSLLWFAYCYVVRFGRPAPPGPILPPILADAALFSVFALHHSALARTRVKTMVSQRLPPGLERSLYTWIASLLFVAVCALWRPVPGIVWNLGGGWALAGYAVQALGVIITLRGASAVNVLDLAGVRPALDAVRGDAARHVPLETAGVYGFVRHPLYFAWALMVLGAPTMTATRATFAVVSTLYLALAIPFEERSLVEVFGPEYEAYRRKVRWRMMPGIY
jgi:protein-S-isoprenylcysteine O-methyltransferase Ste14